MDIPVNAEVYCKDGPCGHSTYVIINPTTWQVTHLVVKGKRFPNVERLVQLDRVTETGPHMIRLGCTRDELSTMEQFIEIEFLPGSVSFIPYGADEYMMWPYVLPQGKDVTIPVSEIDRIEENTVYLELDKHSIEALPAIPVQRR